MSKINNTQAFPVTDPAMDDMVIGTDVSDTGNSSDGETVNFKLNDILDLLEINRSRIEIGEVEYSGQLDSNDDITIETPNAYSFFPNWQTENPIKVSLKERSDAFFLENRSTSNNFNYEVTWKYIKQ